jgi:hypothetical protein
VCGIVVLQANHPLFFSKKQEEALYPYCKFIVEVIYNLLFLQKKTLLDDMILHTCSTLDLLND